MKSTATITLLGLAILASPATQAVSPATAPATTNETLIDARPYLLIRSVDQTKIDTLTNPGTLLLVK